MFKELNKQHKYSLAWFRLKLLKNTVTNYGIEKV